MEQKLMNAAVYHGPNNIQIQKWPLPKLDTGDVLIKVLAASICGTDIRIFHGHHSAFSLETRRVPGHEIVGEVVEVGSSTTGIAKGQRFFVAPNIGCGHCEQCVTGNNNRCRSLQAIGITIDGGFAEYVKVPENGIRQGCLIPFSDQTDPAIGALVEPLACVLRAHEAIGIHMNDFVLVIGAGPIGIMHTKLAKIQGVNRVIVSELTEARREQALALGADRVVNPAQENLNQVINDETNGQGADVIIVAAPAHKAQEQALDLAAIGGRISFFGGLPKDKPNITFNSNLVHYKELIISGTTGSSTDNCRQAVTLINQNKLDLAPLVSARFPLSQIDQAFATASDRHALKIVIEP